MGSWLGPLTRAQPEAVMLRVTGYSQTGPRAHEPGFARIAHAFSGLTISQVNLTASTDAGFNNTCRLPLWHLRRARHYDGTAQCRTDGCWPIHRWALYEPIFRFWTRWHQHMRLTACAKARWERTPSMCPLALPNSRWQMDCHCLHQRQNVRATGKCHGSAGTCRG